jgi:hypothetical protein
VTEVKMPKLLRLTGLPSGGVDSEKEEVHFTLAVSEGRPLNFVAKYGVASQLLTGLGRMLSELRSVLDEKKSAQSIAAEKVAAAHVQRERWTGDVLVQLVTSAGVPYTFAVPADAAKDIATRLTAEASKEGNLGHA